VAAFMISAERVSIHANVVPRTAWEMQSRAVREAYPRQGVSIEGSRHEVPALGCPTNEYGEGTSCKSAIVQPVNTTDACGYWCWEIRQPESPTN
jgi:hypothetical protein